MGYQLFSAEQAAQLPRGGGVLGMDVSRGQVIVDSGMRFELLKVEGLRRGSPASQARLGTGDQVIAVDGRVFPSVAAFAGYVGSLPPGRTIKDPADGEVIVRDYVEWLACAALEDLLQVAGGEA